MHDTDSDSHLEAKDKTENEGGQSESDVSDDENE
jgi:hypothetical protein